MFEKYDSKPKQIEAVQFTNENKDMVFNSMQGNRSADHEDGKPILKVTTIHGETAIVRLGDWIVKESKIGCYYPVKPDIFPTSYEVNKGNAYRSAAAKVLRGKGSSKAAKTGRGSALSQ